MSRSVFVLRTLLSLVGCSVALGAATAPQPAVISLAREPLAAAKASLDRGERGLQPALQRLLRDADRLLEQAPRSVMDKAKTGASGDKHDYFSLAPYWWPDPTKPDGLPYVRRDGEVNSESKMGTDSAAFADKCNAVETLGLAYYFSGRKPYAEKAAQLARLWFLDPATRMNPHLNYGQATPGRNTGRGAGVLEARHLADLTDGLALLAGSNAWSEADEAALRAWFRDYYRWLTTAAVPQEEKRAPNNHGSWYDAQAVHVALYLGKPKDAADLARGAETKRIARQIEPNGTQPLEMARTKSFDYCTFNLEALFRLMTVADKVGVDLWTFSTKDGRSLRAALDRLAPYADPAKPWEKHDLHQESRPALLALFAQVLDREGGPKYADALARYGRADGSERWRLLWNRPLAAHR
jgi:hypothetical protein